MAVKKNYQFADVTDLEGLIPEIEVVLKWT